ncbi:MAG: ABC transporter permease subunit [Anaerolineales bacterium]|nr:ABC transporter permease subunit [Anaerolineales bacterium]
MIAYVLRHMPQAVRSSESALKQLSPSLEEASRTLGRTSIQTIFQVTLPLILPGSVGGWVVSIFNFTQRIACNIITSPSRF